jgi:hypothetical protein
MMLAALGFAFALHEGTVYRICWEVRQGHEVRCIRSYVPACFEPTAPLCVEQGPDCGVFDEQTGLRVESVACELP